MVVGRRARIVGKGFMSKCGLPFTRTDGCLRERVIPHLIKEGTDRGFMRQVRPALDVLSKISDT
jgi:hypothetical protein